jgi:hypothetical protein
MFNNQKIKHDMLGRTWNVKLEAQAESYDFVSRMSSVKQGAVSTDGVGGLYVLNYIFPRFQCSEIPTFRTVAALITSSVTCFESLETSYQNLKYIRIIVPFVTNVK